MSDVSTDERPPATHSLAGHPGLRRVWDRHLRSVPTLRPPARRTVVVVPHPDDESLSSGGLIMHQVARGVPVTVVAVTDGEAAYPAWPDSDLAATRREEQHTALSILGVPATATLRFGLPDGAVDTHGDELVERLRTIINPGDLVVAPWIHDWHPDHVACARAAHEVAMSSSCTLLGSLFWALHHVDPRDHPDVAFAALELTDDECLWRHEALRAHTSQFNSPEPILDESLVDVIRVPVEQYVVSR
jgi:LmbE family N-acetylglucosaminyl deacetylase